MQRVGRRVIQLPMAVLLGWLLAVAFAGPAAASPGTTGPWRVCDGPPWASSSSCVARELRDVDPQGRMVWLTTEVRLDRQTTEPPAVFVSAYASSAAYWDGRLIGMNGLPSARPDLERPGLRDAVFPVPGSTQGTHRLTLQLSSHHGIFRLRSPVTEVSVQSFESSSSRIMRGYLPALISAGGLLIMILIFAFVSWNGSQRESSAYLLGAALFATGQLVAEASRAFLAYSYPLAFVRIGLVLAFAIGFGFMLLAYLAHRFQAARLWPFLLVQALAASTVLFLEPNFDQRTALVLTSAMAIGMLLAIQGGRRSIPGAPAVAAMLALGLVVSLTASHSFVDRDLYLWTAGLFVLLFVEEARRSRHRRHPVEPLFAQFPPVREVPTGISLGTAADRRFVLPSDILRLAAADDYTEIFLAGAGTVLHPEPLRTLMQRLPANFLQIHRSHAINLSHLRAFQRGRINLVTLTDGATVPVSRRSLPRLLAALDAGARSGPPHRPAEADIARPACAH